MRIASFIICDDIRQEVGNKLTLVGIYADTLAFHLPPESQRWPLVIPKLCFYVRLRLDPGESPPDAFELAFMRGDELSSKHEVALHLREDCSRFVNISIMSAPFVIRAPGEIKLRSASKRAGVVVAQHPDEILNVIVTSAASPMSTMLADEISDQGC